MYILFHGVDLYVFIFLIFEGNLSTNMFNAVVGVQFWSSSYIIGASLIFGAVLFVTSGALLKRDFKKIAGVKRVDWYSNQYFTNINSVVAYLRSCCFN